MSDESQEFDDRREEERALKDQVALGESMKQLMETGGGKSLIEQLHQRYALVVLGAVKESETYRLAATNLEEIAAHLGVTLKIADVARENLDRLMSGGEEDY